MIKNKFIKSRILRFYQLLLVLFLFLTSCNTAKYTILFDSGKYLDFGHGKWLMNDAGTNSRFSDLRLYPTALKEFRKILGDSLMEIHDIRRNRLLAPEISFDLDAKQLLKLGEDSGCDYLINVDGRVIKEGIGSFAPQSDPRTEYNSNESSVSIKIYHLGTGMEISSSSIYAKSEQGPTVFEPSQTQKYIPRVVTSSNTALLSAVKRLIRKYEKYGTKNGR